MSEPITLVVESTVVPGQLEPLTDLIAEVSAHCADTEPGLLRYDWFVAADGSEVRVFEQYADSDALRFHASNYAGFLPRLAECRTVARMTVLGEVDAELAATLTERGAAIFSPLASLPR